VASWWERLSLDFWRGRRYRRTTPAPHEDPPITLWAYLVGPRPYLLARCACLWLCVAARLPCGHVARCRVLHCCGVCGLSAL